MKYADELVLMAKEETVLQNMTERLIEIGRFCGMEMKVGKCKVMRISRKPTPLYVMIDQKQLKNVEYFKHFGRIMTKDTKCTREIKSSIARVKAEFNRKKTLFTSKLT